MAVGRAEAGGSTRRTPGLQGGGRGRLFATDAEATRVAEIQQHDQKQGQVDYSHMLMLLRRGGQCKWLAAGFRSWRWYRANFWFAKRSNPESRKRHGAKQPMNFLSRPLLSLTSLLLALSASGPIWAATEKLQYQVSYQGLFSGGARMPVADVSLVSREPRRDSGYLESELQVTSEQYGPVEAFYPIRYRFRAWYLPDASSGLASEYFERNDHADAKHRLIYLDDPEQDFVTRDLAEEGELDLPALLAGTYEPGPATSGLARFDRLALLQRVRSLDLSPGMQTDEMVSNGKKMLRYRVTVEKQDVLQVAGRDWKALKLRFDAFKRNKHGKERPAHRPVHIWFSDDARRLPLLAVGKGAAGSFYIELKAPPAGPRLAMQEVN